MFQIKSLKKILKKYTTTLSDFQQEELLEELLREIDTTVAKNRKNNIKK